MNINLYQYHGTTVYEVQGGKLEDQQVVVVVALFNVFRQPEAAKDGPGFTPWQA